MSILPKNFDWKVYCMKNEDLWNRNIRTKKKAISHWMTYGKNENRPICLEDLDNKKLDDQPNTTENKTKIAWREFCIENTQYINLIYKNSKQQFFADFAIVLVEFRKLPSLEFVLKNAVHKLGFVKIYVVCGDDNYLFFEKLMEDIPSIHIINYHLSNIDVNQYNTLLCSVDFWNNFKEEKLLIMQDDTCLFNSNLNEFMKYDYIGAPWPSEQCDNTYNVGNGGLSLRSRSVMIRVIEHCKNDPDIFEKIKFSDNTLRYMRTSKLQYVPEDVYFSSVMIKYGIGVVAESKIAINFSQEIVKSPKNVFGGHNWWLANVRNNKTHNFMTDFINIFPCAVFISQYPFTLGGGEKYLTRIMKYFIEKKYIVVFFTPSYKVVAMNTLKLYFSEDDIKYIKLYDWNHFINNEFRKQIQPEWFVYMNNIAIPEFIGIGKKNIYHCQFPADSIECELFYHSFDKIKMDKLISSYQSIVINSEFTKHHLSKKYRELTNKNYENKMKILYPPSIENYENNTHNKIKNTFIMIGRIFPYDKFANNKYFDVAIDVFNKLPSISQFKLTIIGSSKSESYLKYLNDKINDKSRIEILSDVSEDVKNQKLKESEYIILLTGINDQYVYNQEHFGISLIEGLQNKCIPICFKGGYPQYIISNQYLVENQYDLYNMIKNILNGELVLEFPNIDMSAYTYENFDNTLGHIADNL
jgi:hypothetical protein